MSFSVEFQDSEVSSVSADGNTLLVRFSAAAAVEEQSGTVGHLKSVELLLQQATWHGNLSLCFGRLAAAKLVTESSASGQVPIPYHSSSPVAIELQFRNGEALVAQAQATTVRINGPASFFESYAC
jgi:hypothetical protein